MPTTVTVRSGEELTQLKARLGDLETIGNIIARVLESQSQKTFLEQKLGEFAWPERYPNQDDPFVNVAALVNWTSTGGTIRSRFFDRRPALMGVSNPGLMSSIQSRVKKGLVEVGSNLPYAPLHQWGGTSSQPITDTTKKTVGKFIGEEKVDGEWRKKKTLGSKQKQNREKYFSKLFPLLGQDELETQVNQRPFLGITPENESDMAATIEAFVAGKGAT